LKEYWRNIAITTKTLSKGLSLTLGHLKDARSQRDPISPQADNYFEKQNAIFTVQYPKEVLPVPTVGRYKLHNEIEDCIVCDKCAKICPVDCIDIEPVRAVEEFGKTSDGTSKRIYAAKFDIDMAKCCFCGLCTTVCPTECLTMTDDYDFSSFDIKDHNFEFGNMTPLEILQRKEELAAFQEKKEAEKAAASKATQGVARPKVPGFKPAASKPMMKPKVSGTNTDEKSKPVFKPRIQPKKSTSKPVIKKSQETSKVDEGQKALKPKIPMKPVIKKKENQDEEDKPKTARPKVPARPKIPPKKKEE
jgi:formate hydrogenlyase subunit 6/NADH:ubiquinone oxidoreductase subunit I